MTPRASLWVAPAGLVGGSPEARFIQRRLIVRRGLRVITSIPWGRRFPADADRRIPVRLLRVLPARWYRWIPW